MGSIKQRAIEEISSLPESAELAEMIDRLYRLMKFQNKLTSNLTPERALTDSEQREAWQVWSSKGPQGPIEDEGSDWP